MFRKTIVTWQWQDSSENWHSYDQPLSAQIEDYYRSAKPELLLSIRHMEFKIDLISFEQRRSTSGRVRSMRRIESAIDYEQYQRECFSATLANPLTNSPFQDQDVCPTSTFSGSSGRDWDNWYWQDGSRWCPYDPKSNQIIESFYKNEWLLHASDVLTIHIGQSMYLINFQLMQQMSTVTGFRREIRRGNAVSATNFQDKAISSKVLAASSQVPNSDPLPASLKPFLEQICNCIPYELLPSDSSNRCPICLDTLSEVEFPLQLPCSHIFCTPCLNLSLTCPICKRIYGIKTGTQPTNGIMDWCIISQSCSGFAAVKTIRIKFIFPSGIQGPEHPTPGSRYNGSARTAYLPDTEEGQKVLRLFQIAFDRRLLFRIGTSLTTGADNSIVWAGIHMKTSLSGGVANHGYPDDTYFTRVLQELKDVGVMEINL